MRLFQVLLITCFLFMATSATADAALLSVYPTGTGSFTINGSNLDDVFGMDLKIVYDTPELQDPKFTKGALIANALMDDNIDVPGEIVLLIAGDTEISGSGQIVAITFTSPTGVGRITSVMAKLRDGNGVAVPVSVTITKPGDCDYNGTVTIAEVQSAINMFLEVNTVKGCVDINTNNAVNINEVQTVINGFLGL